MNEKSLNPQTECSLSEAILQRSVLLMPKVSVIIPTYNRPSMLKEAVDSVLTQDFEDFELIVVDDGSTDGTAEEIERYGGRVKLIQHSENRGVSAARNGSTVCLCGKVTFSPIISPFATCSSRSKIAIS